MKHLNAIVAYHMIEKAKDILHGEAKADSVQRACYAATREQNMIEIKTNHTYELTCPATYQEIEKAMTDETNKRIELMRVNHLAERLKQVEDELSKERTQQIERSLPTNAA